MTGITVRDVVKAVGGRLLCGSEKTELRHISINSREMRGEDLFIPLIGEKTDAHRFITSAFENGAAATLTSRHDSMEGDRPWIAVKDTRKALQDLGAYLRDRLSLPIVGITGSVGKTTTREMVSAALGAGLRVFKTEKNQNGQLGVPITLSDISPEDEIAVIEMGMSLPGEMEVIARIARVTAAVVTNIGVAHIENLGSRERIMEEKLKIQDGMAEGGVLLLNGDNDLLAGAAARPGIRRLFYGTGKTCDYRAEDVRLENGFPVFTAVHRDVRVPVRLSVMGEHNVLNAMAALAVADLYGVPMDRAALALEGYTGFEGRQRIFDWNGVHMDDDTYNASPDSMRAAVRVLCAMDCQGRRIAVLADMKELGPQEKEFHRQVGLFIGGQPVDEVITLGPLARYIAEGAMEENPKIRTASFEDRTELEHHLRSRITKGDCVLFKGSNSMRLGELAAHFKENGQEM